jgi:pimeloyl-ACP methyl ester carboxylesterase
LPLAVITSAEVDPNFVPGSHWYRARSRFYPGWVVLQNELATLSTNSTYVVAEHGGHHLNRDNPELVAEVVIDLVKRIRSQP